MIEEKDYLLRTIRQLGEVLRALSGKDVVSLESQSQSELEQFLEELTGLSGDLLRLRQYALYQQMVNMMPDQNQKMLAAKALSELGRINNDHECIGIAAGIAVKINPDLLVRDLLPEHSLLTKRPR